MDADKLFFGIGFCLLIVFAFPPLGIPLVLVALFAACSKDGESKKREFPADLREKYKHIIIP